MKVIFENCYLSEVEKMQLCQVCGDLGADWVKTSTGFGEGGATLDDVQLMAKLTPKEVQVKAAGGIRDFDTLLLFREIGATRIGASRTPAILDECKRAVKRRARLRGGRPPAPLRSTPTVLL